VARKLFAELAKTHRDVVQYRNDLAGTHFWLGNLLRTLSRRKEALEQWVEARNLRAALAKAHPDVSEYKSDLVQTCFNRGNPAHRDERPAQCRR